MIELAPLRAALRRAAMGWTDAGMARRLAVLQAIGRTVAARRGDLEAALRGDGFSRRMAVYWSAWIVRAADPEVMAFQARALLRATPATNGNELLVRRPDGVVLLSPPANSPTLQLATLFSILLPGNAVLVRAPERSPGAVMLARDLVGGALVDAGFDAALVSLVAGRSREVLDHLLPSGVVDTVVFFGNSATGQEVARRSSQHGCKVVLELDGSDCLVVWRDADIEAAAESAARAWHASTTPCVVPKQLLVHEAVWERFSAALIDRTAGVTTVAADPEQGLLLPVHALDAWRAALDELAPRGQLLQGGHRMRADGSFDEAGAYAAPTVIAIREADLEPRPRFLDQEINFPLLPLIRYAGDDHAAADRMCDYISASQFGLRASIWAQAPAVIAHFTRRLGAVGLLRFNLDHAATPQFASPWGGPKRSGGPHGESHFFAEKTSHLQAIDGCLDPLQRSALLAALGANEEPRS